MIIRRVKEHYGGIHLISDVLQYRDKVGDPWSNVEVINAHEALLRDLRDGTVALNDLGATVQEYWREKMEDKA